MTSLLEEERCLDPAPPRPVSGSRRPNADADTRCAIVGEESVRVPDNRNAGSAGMPPRHASRQRKFGTPPHRICAEKRLNFKS